MGDATMPADVMSVCQAAEDRWQEAEDALSEESGTASGESEPRAKQAP